MPSSIPEISTKGFAKASAYEAHRPSYPAEAVDALLTHLHLSGVRGAAILDLAAGTGKFTESLAARPEGYEIVAVEPHDEMRAELQRKALKGTRVVNGEATDMPEVETQSVDGVVVAQVSGLF